MRGRELAKWIIGTEERERVVQLLLLLQKVWTPVTNHLYPTFYPFLLLLLIDWFFPAFFFGCCCWTPFSLLTLVFSPVMVTLKDIRYARDQLLFDPLESTNKKISNVEGILVITSLGNPETTFFKKVEQLFLHISSLQFSCFLICTSA